MNLQKLPYSNAIYILGLLSCFLFCFGGFAIIPAVASFILAKRAQKIHKENPDTYSNIKQVNKGKIIAIIGIILNLVIITLTIWTLTTIGWDAWSDEFVRKWNEGLENGRS